MRLYEVKKRALENLKEAIEDYTEKNGEAPTVDDIELMEIADSVIPIYNFDLLQLAMDDLWLGYAEFADQYDSVYEMLMRNIFDHIYEFLHDNFEEVLNE